MGSSTRATTDNKSEVYFSPLAASSSSLATARVNQTRRQKRQHSNKTAESDINGDNIKRNDSKNRCDSLESSTPAEPLSEANAEIAKQLARFYKLDASTGSPPTRSGGGLSAQNWNNISSQPKPNGAEFQQQLQNKIELPRPTNLSVLIISWYPPILKLSWNLEELDTADENKLDFYNGTTATTTETTATSMSALFRTAPATNSVANSSSGEQTSRFDWDLALESREDGSSGGDSETIDALATRRNLLKKSLTCFQVTYNIVESRLVLICNATS